MKGKKFRSIVLDGLYLAAAEMIIAAAVFFFLEPSHAAICSVSGLAIVLQVFIPLPLSLLVLIMNSILLVIGFLLAGKEFGIKTVYTSLLMSVFLWMFEVLFPDFTSITHDQVLDAACYIFVISAGQTLLFHDNASSGGTDIIGKIMHQYTHLELGTCLMIVGTLIALSSAFAYDGKTVVISMLGSYLGGMVLDRFLYGFSLKRRVTVVSNHEKELVDFIIHQLHSGASVYQFYGAYHMETRREVVTIVDHREFQKLMNYIRQTDPDAFLTVYQVSDMHYKPKERIE
jgi:uncharacterized membrane-anchored protein YitT (DUF2179 family)